MSNYSFKIVVSRAFVEALAAIRWENWTRVLTTLAVPSIVGFITWFSTGKPVLTGFLTVVALLTLGTAIFVAKLVSVPLSMAAEADAERVRVQDDLGRRLSSLEERQAEQRDPDGIYQMGVLVARALHPTPVLHQGIIHFQAIINAYDLNIDRTFEYREYVLLKAHAENGSMTMVGNQKPDRTITNVVARVVARRGELATTLAP